MFKRLIFTCLLICAIAGSAFSRKQQVPIFDSITYVRYQQAMEDLTNPAVLLIADTLFDMARQDNYPRLQAVALRTKLDYYYYKNDANSTDSVVAWVERVKDFARKNKLLDYYYFAWSARLINHYIGLGEYNFALIETEKMLKEAEAEDYKEGIADCYGCMSNIYSAKQLVEESLKFLLKEIEVSEKYKLQRFNISLRYSDAAKICIDEGDKEKAYELLKKAAERALNPYHKVTAKITYIWFYLSNGDISQANALLEESRQLYAENQALKRHLRYLYEVEVAYYREIRKYASALDALTLWEEELEKKNETVSISRVRKIRADVYWDMNRKEEAGILYREYLKELEREKEKNEEITTGEFATLLNMQKLNVEKRELEQLSQEKQLQNTRIIVFSLAALLCIVVLFLYYQHKLNKKLERSRDKLDEKNRILLQAEEDLRRAKEMAERSSQLKTVFIQNMSHEIRTPLNSIVGFSTVLADLFSNENEDVKQFATLIEDNSQLLLKLISDILEISSLDDFNGELDYAPTDINACCVHSIEVTNLLLSEKTKLVFKPEFDELIIESNSERISQVLTNLLNNAAKFTREGEITLAYEVIEEKNELVFTVTDTGIGIPPEQREHVFDRFVKLNEFSQGTGLGLPICKIVAEKLGGYLMIDKEYTKGTRIIFSIPAINR